ncbi:hypothetical protein J1N35_019489 [Gossypium stocksii]|uniref:Uncharacterized protein n=1 Tax=Gossypium stocksii TaxID=47602 RepID=A0A9D3VS85_9ROSI|nr:hypothetical protein J1N35_019489 [Gossypium stocksii]
MEVQFKDFMLDSLGANAEKMNELVNSTTKKLAERHEALEDMVKKEIEELKGKLTIYKVVLSNGMLSSRPKQQAIDANQIHIVTGPLSKIVVPMHQDMKVRTKFKLRGDESQVKGSEGRDDPITRQVEEKPRQRESFKTNQVSAIRKPQRGRCENG